MKKMLAFFILLSVGYVWAQNQDEAQVRKLIPAFTDAWARSDAEGLAWLFTPDGDLVIPTGQVMSGRDAVGAFYASVFAAGYRGSKGTGEVERMRFIRPDVVVGDGTWSITGAHDKQGKATPEERGVFTFVAVKRDDHWHISALREQTSAIALKSN